MKKWRLVFYCI